MLHANPFGYSRILRLDAEKQQQAKVLAGQFVTSGAPARKDKFLFDQTEFASYSTPSQLSILSNYRQITRILTASYLKAPLDHKKFRDRGRQQANLEKDPEFANY